MRKPTGRIDRKAFGGLVCPSGEFFAGAVIEDDGSTILGSPVGPEAVVDYLLCLHPDETVSLGREVVVRWSDDGLTGMLTAPWTDVVFTFTDRSQFITGGDRRQTPEVAVIRDLEALPRGTHVAIGDYPSVVGRDDSGGGTPLTLPPRGAEVVTANTITPPG